MAIAETTIGGAGGGAPSGMNPAAWAAYQANIGGGGGGVGPPAGSPGGGGGAYDPYANYPITWGGTPAVIPDPYANYPISWGGVQPTGTPEDWMIAQGGPGGNYNTEGGYYGTGGGMGYIHGSPEDDLQAWQLYTDMLRNGWNVDNPFGIDEARRGMGEFSDEQIRQWTIEHQQQLQNEVGPHQPQGGEKFNEWLMSVLGKGKLGKLGFGKWLKNKADNETPADWLDQLNDTQRVWLDEWMRNLGVDKNWEDRIRAGDAPWSRGQDVVDKTGTKAPHVPAQNPKEPPQPGGGGGGPKDGGGGGGEGEPAYSGPLGLPDYGGAPYQPSFLAYQPYNTNGPVQFVPGRS